MAFYRSKTYSAGARIAKPRRAYAGGAKGKGFAASPAGKHRKLALNAFALARKAKAAGNAKHYWRMVGFGKKALALSRAELQLWKKGAMLRTKAFAAHRAVRTARYR